MLYTYVLGICLAILHSSNKEDSGIISIYIWSKSRQQTYYTIIEVVCNKILALHS